VNVGTSIKRAYLNAVAEFLGKRSIGKIDAHAALGWGGGGDMLSCGREAITSKICEYIDLFGSEGKANDFCRAQEFYREI
jgi:fructose-bisphosphate aldolase class II